MIAADQKKAVRRWQKNISFLGIVAAILVLWWAFEQAPRMPVARLEEVGVTVLDESGQDFKDALEIGRRSIASNSADRAEAVKRGKNISDQPLVYGFFPYWNMKSGFEVPHVVTDLAFFRLLAQENGLLVFDQNSDGSWQEVMPLQAWLDMTETWQSSFPGKRRELVIFQDDPEQLEQLLLNEEAIDTLVLQVHQVLEAKTQKEDQPDWRGINLDFEYFGTASEPVRDGMSLLLSKLRLLIGQYHPEVRLTVDVFGKLAYRSQGLFDWESVAENVDYVILMGYDYTTRSSIVPGPVAPTIGRSRWGNDILGAVEALAKKIPSYQIILGVPYYGYQWEVTTFDLSNSRTYPETGRTLTYQRVQEMLVEKEALGITEGWDEASLTPFFYYEGDEERPDGTGKVKYLAFYENEESLKYKLDLINGMGLGGMAIWALGYEGMETGVGLWDLVRTELYEVAR